jgi:hypothetical protein
MACDELVMPANTSLWVHDPAAWIDAWGYQNARALRDTAEKVINLADDLDTTRDQLIATYRAKAGEKLSRDELVTLMERETTITAEQAVAWSLADCIEEPLQQAACHDMGKVRDAAHEAFRARLEKAREAAAARPVDPPPAGPRAIPQPMEARALVALCRESDSAALAPALIEAGATE